MRDMPGDQETFSPVQKLVISEVLIAFIIVISLMAFFALYAQKPVVEQKEIQATVLNVDAFLVTEIDVQELLTGFGTVQADREVTLAAQVTGEIVEINPQLKVGYAVLAEDMVQSPNSPSRRQAAELLLKIDPRLYQQRLDQAKNQIAETETDIERLTIQESNLARQLKKSASVLKTLKEEYDRIQQAVTLKAASASDLNRALLDLQRYEDTVIQLESQVASIPHQIAAVKQRLLTAQSEKNRAADDLAKTEVTPPFGGVLSEVLVEQGQYVRAGEPLLRLTSVTQVEVPISLSFDDFLQLDKVLAVGGKPAVALSENETAESRWNGFVVRASPEADSISRTVQVFVEINNTNEASRLLPGTFVHARIDGDIYNGKLLIPREAVLDSQVFVVDADNVTRRRRIRTGRRLHSMVVVEIGLAPGDRIATTNLDILEDGREVVVQFVSNPEDEIRSLDSPEIRLLNPAAP
jgi:multidrug efflux pump subunit AcrA (membrane-fusion protein)